MPTRSHRAQTLGKVAHSTYQPEIESTDAIRRAIFCICQSSIFAVVAESEDQIIRLQLPRQARSDPYLVGFSFYQFLPFYRPPAFSIALIIIFLASSPDRFVTVKCATDWRRRVFFFASTEISVICIATRGARRSTIVISLSFSLAKVHPQNGIFTSLP